MRTEENNTHIQSLSSHKPVLIFVVKKATAQIEDKLQNISEQYLLKDVVEAQLVIVLQSFVFYLWCCFVCDQAGKVCVLVV